MRVVFFTFWNFALELSVIKTDSMTEANIGNILSGDLIWHEYLALGHRKLLSL